MPPVYVLSEKDRNLLRRLVEETHSLSLNTRNRPGIGDFVHTSPGGYVALTPSGGIPGRSGLVLGSAECQIYQLHEEDGAYTLELVDDFTHLVHNLSETTLPSNIIAKIERDRYGNWFVEQGALAVGEYHTLECIGGFLYLLRCQPGTGGEVECVPDVPLGIPCGGGGGGGDPPYLPPTTFPVVMEAVSEVCPVVGSCVEITSAESPVSLTQGAFKVVVDASGGAVTINLPPWRDGDFYYIIRIDATGNTVTIQPNAGLINGAASITLSGQWSSAMIDTLCDTDAWYARL